MGKDEPVSAHYMAFHTFPLGNLFRAAGQAHMTCLLPVTCSPPLPVAVKKPGKHQGKTVRLAARVQSTAAMQPL